MVDARDEFARWAEAFSTVSVVFQLRPRARCELPPFLGSTLRGAIGHALRDIAPEVLEAVFDGPKGDGPGYVLSPPRPRQAPWRTSDALRFGVTLFGEAGETFPQWADAVLDAATAGLGRGRHPFILERVEEASNGRTLWSLGDEALHQPEPVRPAADRSWDGAEELEVHLVTPLALRRDGHLLRSLDYSSFGAALTRRCRNLASRWCGVRARKFEYAGASPEIKRQHLSWTEWSRYSARQQRAVPLGGLAGRFAIRGEGVATVLPLLAIAELVHVGRQTAFGLGEIAVSAGDGDPG